MGYKVVSGFFPTESRAKTVLKKVPTIFSKPHIEQAKNGTWAVVAGEYERKDWANKAIHKLFEAGLMGGIWLQN
jgi:hypothetical protein